MKQLFQLQNIIQNITKKTTLKIKILDCCAENKNIALAGIEPRPTGAESEHSTTIPPKLRRKELMGNSVAITRDILRSFFYS